MRWFIFSYALFLLTVLLYSYGFVDPSLTLSTNSIYQKLHEPLFAFVFHMRALSTLLFIFIILIFSIYYVLVIWFLKRKKLTIRHLCWIMGLTVGILLFSYPAFSYDIFNYILTAKVTFFYKENPYIVMPVELLGEPNLAFTRAANKTAIYGPFWIGLTALPHLLGFGKVVLTLFSFKLFVSLFYVLTSLLTWKITRSLLSVALFALNPLVVVETLISAHNDMVMMFFALLAFYLLTKKAIIPSCVALLLSILIKYATVFLLPVFLYAIYLIQQRRKLNWELVFVLAGWSMLVAFFLSPLREEIYPWYVIWMLSFAVLVPKRKFFLSLVLTLSFATLLRYAPVLYMGNYFGVVPLVKELVTFVPLFVFSMFWIRRKIIV